MSGEVGRGPLILAKNINGGGGGSGNAVVVGSLTNFLALAWPITGRTTMVSPFTIPKTPRFALNCFNRAHFDDRFVVLSICLDHYGTGNQTVY